MNMLCAGLMYIDDKGRVLLCRRAQNVVNGGLWAFPAGHVEEGESPEQAASREFMEETGRVAKDVRLVTESLDFVLYAARGATFNPILNDEHDGYVWATVSDLPAPLHPGILDLFQTFSMDSARTEDVNGYLEIDRNPISCVGVFPYKGSQIPGAPDPDAIYMVYRPEEELNNPETIDSFKLVPWIDNHVMLGEGEGLTAPEEKGIEGVTGERVFFEGDTLFSNLRLFSASLKSAIEAGKSALSLGYRCRYEWAQGEFKDQIYQVIQRGIRGNHLASVLSGRMGPKVAVLDGLALDQMTFTLDSKDVIVDDDKVEKKDDDTTAKKSEEKVEESGMSLEDAVKAVHTIMPALKKIMSMSDAPSEKEEVGATDDEVEKPGDKDQSPKAQPMPTAAEKEGKGMDAALTFKEFAKITKERDQLAAQLRPLVGTFDHSEMDAQDVAAYGCKKLGITAAEGSERHVLAGYLAAKPKTPVIVAQDSAHGESFVSKYLSEAK